MTTDPKKEFLPLRNIINEILENNFALKTFIKGIDNIDVLDLLYKSILNVQFAQLKRKIAVIVGIDATVELGKYASSTINQYDQTTKWFNAITASIFSLDEKIHKELNRLDKIELLDILCDTNVIFTTRFSYIPKESFDNDIATELPKQTHKKPQLVWQQKTNKSVTASGLPIIDGKWPTPNEIMFENFYQNKFNEGTWLKKLHIDPRRIYDEENEFDKEFCAKNKISLTKQSPTYKHSQRMSK